jgi:hypothetical protein
MRIIVLVQLKMMTWLHKTTCLVLPLLMLLETYQSLLRIGVCRLLDIGMQNPNNNRLI